MNRRLKSILSILCILIIIGLLVATIVLAIKGSPNFMGMLALTIIFPIFVWAMVHFYNFFKNDR